MSVEMQERAGARVSSRQWPLPPGSRSPAIVQTAAALRDPAGFLIRSWERYGDCYRVSLIGLPPLAYVARPDLVGLAFDTDKGGGRAGATRAEVLEPVVGRNSLLTLDGEQWLRQRRLLGPPLHGEAIDRYRDQITEIAVEEIERWPLGAPLKLRPRMQAIALEVILRVVFGLSGSERHQRLRVLLPRLISRGAVVGFLPARAVTTLQRLDRRPRAARRVNPVSRLLDVRDEVDTLLYAEIAERRGTRDGRERQDILSVLLAARDEHGTAMSDTELRDELVTLLAAGHETTATGLAWAFERLARHPAVLERLEQELEGGDREYLAAVVRECLRIRPVVVDTARLLTEPLELDGYTVPAGWWIATAIPAVHMNPAVWPQPQELQPERFLSAGVPPHAWIPFGGGQRRCVGSRLAMLEMEVVVAEVIRRLRLRPANHKPESARLSHVTLVPARQAEVIASPRSS